MVRCPAFSAAGAALPTLVGRPQRISAGLRRTLLALGPGAADVESGGGDAPSKNTQPRLGDAGAKASCAICPADAMEAAFNPAASRSTMLHQEFRDLGRWAGARGADPPMAPHMKIKARERPMTRAIHRPPRQRAGPVGQHALLPTFGSPPSIFVKRRDAFPDRADVHQDGAARLGRVALGVSVALVFFQTCCSPATTMRMSRPRYLQGRPSALITWRSWAWRVSLPLAHSGPAAPPGRREDILGSFLSTR